jgi:hypothetical protein
MAFIRINHCARTAPVVRLEMLVCILLSGNVGATKFATVAYLGGGGVPAIAPPRSGKIFFFALWVARPPVNHELGHDRPPVCAVMAGRAGRTNMYRKGGLVIGSK